MSTPTTLFDHRAQPFWDEAGNYFPPGFDPQTGQWIDPAYEDAYAQGFVWDASLQDWAPLDLSGIEVPQEPLVTGREEGSDASSSKDVLDDGEALELPTLGDPVREREIFEAILHALDASPDSAHLRETADGAAQRQALALATAAATKRLLDAIARDMDETTALVDAGDMPTVRLILSILQDIAPKPEATPIDLLREACPSVLPSPAMPLDAAPAPRRAILPEELDRGAAPLANNLWEVVEARDLSREGPEGVRLATLIEAPPLPFDDTADAPLAAQIARDGRGAELLLKNATPLPLGFDGEVDLRPHPKAAPRSAAAAGAEQKADLLRKIERALDILAQAEPGQLDKAIYFPLDVPCEDLERTELIALAGDGDTSTSRIDTDPSGQEHGRLFPNASADRAFTASLTLDRDQPADDIELALTALADSVGHRAAPPPTTAAAAKVAEMPLVRLKRPDRSLDGEAAKFPATTAFVPAGPSAPTVRIKRHIPSEELVEVVAPIDLPSDDIELALTALAKFVKRQSRANLAASAPPPPSAFKPPKPARRAPPPLPGKKAVHGKKPPLPIAPALNSQKVSQKPMASLDRNSALPKPVGAAASSTRPSNVPVAIALNGDFRVLCRTLDGVVHRGILRHPNLTAPTLTLDIHPGPTSLTLETRSLQAIFFLRRPGQDSAVPEGRKARLLFKSGRQRSGYIPAFDPHGSGFFFYPNETQDSPTDFWFVYGAGLTSIDFE